jgi:hypothetical protein
LNPQERAIFRLRQIAEFLVGMIETDRQQRGLEPSRMLENCQRMLAEIDADLDASKSAGLAG